MEPRPFIASSKWLSALVALLVALGAQVLLESVVPASSSEVPFTTARLMNVESLWVSESVIRLLSFAMGGGVAVLLARGISRALFAMLFVIAVLASLFQQFPGRGPLLVPLAIWSLAGPVGIIVGAWAMGARRTDA